MEPGQEPNRQSSSTLMSHPVTFFAERVHEVLDEVTAVSTAGLSGESAGEAAVRLARAEARLAALRLRLLDKAHRADVGQSTASSTAAWWAQAATVDRARARREVQLADCLTTELNRTEVTLAAGGVSSAQSEVIVDSVRALPSSVGPVDREKAELHMLELVGKFGPKELKVLGKRLLDVIDPDDADARLAAQLEAEERAAERTRFLEMHDDGDGTTHGRFAIPTLAGDMLRTALNAFASPRRPDGYPREDADGAARPNAVLLGQAFMELIERYPADRIPQSGGVNATLIVTIPLDTLLGGLQSAHLLTGHHLSPGQMRRLACEAGLRTSVDDAVSLCSRHHTRAHDTAYETKRTATGRLAFIRIRQ